MGLEPQADRLITYKIMVLQPNQGEENKMFIDIVNKTDRINICTRCTLIADKHLPK